METATLAAAAPGEAITKDRAVLVISFLTTLLHGT
jgi:hypothetical protein